MWFIILCNSIPSVAYLIPNCVIPFPAEDQQASLQLLRLRCVQRAAVDGQDPELHLGCLRRHREHQRRRRVVESRDAKKTQKRSTWLYICLNISCFEGGPQPTKCLTVEGENCPRTSLPVTQQPVRLSSLGVAPSQTHSSLLSAPSAVPPNRDEATISSR